MRIAIVGATGNVGTRLVAELTGRGHHVTAIARKFGDLAPQPNVTQVVGDAGDPVALAAILAGHDAVISSLRFLGNDPSNLIAAVRQSGVKRYLVVGGAGSLEIAPGQRLVDQPFFPAEYKPEALGGSDFLDALRPVTDLDWTFFSPAAFFLPGERTGKFRLGLDTLIAGPDHHSSISYEDFAVAAADELEHPKHIKARFTIGY